MPAEDAAAIRTYRMSQQPKLRSSDLPNGMSSGGAGGGARGPGQGSRGKLPIWLQRLEVFLRVVVRLYVGVLILLLPWTHLWDDNRLLNFYPWLAQLTLNGVTRGIVSGFGLLNLWIAISDAIHYRES